MTPLTSQKIFRRRPTPLHRKFLAMGFTFSMLYLNPGKSSFADPPEESVWRTSPSRLEIERFGPQNDPFDPKLYSEVYHVSRLRGSDDTGGGESDRAWKTLSHALSVVAAKAVENRVAILVAEGTYPETPVRMIRNVDLYGGFQEDSWARDIWAHATLLDGELERRVLEGATNARVDGFHIVRGRSEWHGGGILCYRASPQIFNNVIRNNLTSEPMGFVHDPLRRRHLGNDGGGIACVDGAHPEIAHNLIFENGTEVGQGGGIACLNDSCPKITYNFIYRNVTGTRDNQDTRTSNGGGISCFAGCLPIISNNLIANNYAGGRSDGGGIYCEYDGSPVVTFNYILGNAAGDDGGGMEIMKGSYPQVDSNILVGNRTYKGSGGGLRISDRGLGEITNNLIAANSRSGVVCSNAWMNLVNNTIIHNFGMGKTYGVYFDNERWVYLMPPSIRNNLVWSNQTTEEASFETLPTKSQPPVEFLANWVGQDDDEGEESGTNPKIDAQWLRGSVSALKPRSDRFATEVAIEEDNLAELGLLGRPVQVGSEWSVIVAASERGFEVWGTIEAATDYAVLPSYRLLAGSSCIGAGAAEASPLLDFEGDPRSPESPLEESVDIGYDEFVAPSQ